MTAKDMNDFVNVQQTCLRNKSFFTEVNEMVTNMDQWLKQNRQITIRRRLIKIGIEKKEEATMTKQVRIVSNG